MAVLATCHGPTTGAGAASPTAPAPTIDPGPRWQQATASLPFESTSHYASLVFAPSGQTEKLWIIGGSFTDQDAIWSSADGITWTKAPKSTDAAKRFSARRSHTSLVFKDRMWVIGGTSTGSTGDKNDVWSSADGKDWTWVNEKATDTAKFSARLGHTSLVFADPNDGNTDKMWVIGGTSTGSTGYKNDVWSSADGISWIKVEPRAGGRAFSARVEHTSLVFKGKMWVLGGQGGGQDVWSSGDGKDWKQEPTPAWSARYNFGSVVFTDPADGLAKMWVMGGSLSLNDVWWSTDGQRWSQARFPDWSKREAYGSAVFRDKIWVLSDFKHNDVWYYPDSPAIVPGSSPQPAGAAGNPPGNTAATTGQQ